MQYTLLNDEEPLPPEPPPIPTLIPTTPTDPDNPLFSRNMVRFVSFLQDEDSYVLYCIVTFNCQCHLYIKLLLTKIFQPLCHSDVAYCPNNWLAFFITLFFTEVPTCWTAEL